MSEGCQTIKKTKCAIHYSELLTQYTYHYDTNNNRMLTYTNLLKICLHKLLAKLPMSAEMFKNILMGITSVNILFMTEYLHPLAFKTTSISAAKTNSLWTSAT